MQFGLDGVVLIVQLAVLILGAIFIIGYLTGASKWFTTRYCNQNSPNEVGVQRFIKQSVERMLKDERAVTAIYAQAQSFSDDAGYLLAAVAFFFGVNALAIEVDMGWIGNLVSLSSAAVCAVAIWAMGRVDQRIYQYRAIIALYEKEIELPPRP